MSSRTAHRPGSGAYRIPAGTIGVEGSPASFALAELHYAALPRCKASGHFTNGVNSEIRLFRVERPYGVPRDRFAEYGLRVLLPGTEIAQ